MALSAKTHTVQLSLELKFPYNFFTGGSDDRCQWYSMNHRNICFKLLEIYLPGLIKENFVSISAFWSSHLEEGIASKDFPWLCLLQRNRNQQKKKHRHNKEIIGGLYNWSRTQADSMTWSSGICSPEAPGKRRLSWKMHLGISASSATQAWGVNTAVQESWYYRESRVLASLPVSYLPILLGVVPPVLPHQESI